MIQTVVEKMDTVEKINPDIAPRHVARKPSKSNIGSVPQIESDLEFCKQQIKLITGCISKLQGKLEELSRMVQDMEGGKRSVPVCVSDLPPMRKLKNFTRGGCGSRRGKKVGKRGNITRWLCVYHVNQRLNQMSNLVIR